MAEDKRIKHTKMRIQDAMLTCLQDTSPEHITVKRICDIAEVNRSTFYTYYSDPIALYSKMEEEAIAGFQSTTALLREKKISYPQFLTQLLGYVGENSRTFLALLKTNRDSMEKVNFVFLERENLRALAGGDEVNPYELEFYIGGMLALITKWLKGGQKETPEEIAGIICRLNTGKRGQ